MDMRLMKSSIVLTEEYNGHEIDEVQAVPMRNTMDMRLMKSRLILTEEYNGHEIDEVQADTY